ncbi:hypothetical protein HYPSUDRAFT_206380 [Hypholoma sublateritium FD-334 SS-4]|uniref:Uncharacterized protein n=1 Tax=Hypholoma sublateritium (strain FD-334 SS-4) TaxID=945553 RepID=A0A0D2PA74_HYPSF|nr:hypothetical protein HYPSUDRAFT_206380 [Hypholoma sublateritium FD-334 SS-4]
MTFGVTMLTTVLIAYQIYSVIYRDTRKGPTRTFKDIADVLVQSAAAYSLVALWNAVMAIIPQGDTNETLFFSAENYMSALLLITAGMAPTIMVARVAMQASRQAEDAPTAHISDLEFRGQSNPSVNTSQILSQGIRARAGVRDDISSEGRDSEKQGPLAVNAPVGEE